MFGVFFGTVCLGLLFLNLRRHRYAGSGWGWGGHGFGSYYGHRHGPPWAGRSPKRRAVQYVLERLDTTPGQEKVLRRTVETVRESLDDVGEDLQSARRALAQAIAGEELDQAALTSAIEKQEAILNRVKVELVEAVKTVHETLDGRQRRALAEWIAEGCSWRDLRVRDSDRKGDWT